MINKNEVIWKAMGSPRDERGRPIPIPHTCSYCAEWSKYGKDGRWYCLQHWIKEVWQS